MSGLTEGERRHVEAIGPAAVEWLTERWAIMVEDGQVPEAEAWRLAYERTCAAYGVRALSRQGLLQGVAA